MTSPRFPDYDQIDCNGWKQRVELEERVAVRAQDGRVQFRGHGPYVSHNYLMGANVESLSDLSSSLNGYGVGQRPGTASKNKRNKQLPSIPVDQISNRTPRTESTFTAPSARGSIAAKTSSSMRRMDARMGNVEKALEEERQDTAKIYDELAEIKSLLMQQRSDLLSRSGGMGGGGGSSVTTPKKK
eukprot:PhM_4_TR10212/c0_g1_i1/m.92960